MGRLAKWLRLPTPQRWLLLRAFLWLSVVRIGLWVLPFQQLPRFVKRVTSARTERSKRAALWIENVPWAITVASRYVPGTATCLPQALGTQILLQRAGAPAHLHIGVGKGEQGEFQAHAWVESQGEIVIGADAPGNYTPLWVLGREDQ